MLVGNSSVWLNFNLNMKNKIARLPKKSISKIVPVRLESLFAEICATFTSIVLQIQKHVIQKYTKLANFARL